MRQRFAQQDNIFKRTILNSKFFTLVVIVIIVLISQPLIKKINQRRDLNREISALEQEVDRIENKNDDLRGLIDYLDSDGFTEKEARLNLDLRKPGEKVAIIKGTENNFSEQEEVKTIFNVPGLDKEQPESPKNNLKKWRDYFFAVR
ncbi:MAG: septum formation initiator family protein [Patescibacteria group bacterium]|jgi:cell division protein FtsB